MKIKYAVLAALTITLFQNCSAPQADSVPAAVIIGGGRAPVDGNGDFSSDLPTMLTASYSPNPLLAGAVATINVSNGIAPYTYRKLSGAGTLTANRYTSPAVAETALIGITDANGNAMTLQIIVVTDEMGSGGNTGGETMTPTPTPQPTPDVAALAKKRDCDLQGIQAVFNIATAIQYEYCLVLGRFANDMEAYNWYHAIKGQKLSPRDLPPFLFQAPDLNQRYNTGSMTNEVYVVFMVNHLLHRNPTPAEGAQLLAVGAQQGQAGIYNAIMASPTFFQANPFLSPVQNF